MIPTYTSFFRESNIADFSVQYAPRLAEEIGGKLLLGQIGCSSGEETWSTASALEVAQVPYGIEGCDLDPQIIEASKHPYVMGQPDYLTYLLKYSRFPEQCVQYFDTRTTTDDSGATITSTSPVEALRDKAELMPRDILHKPLPAERYGAVILNNVLYHHTGETRDRLVEIAVESLQPGGMLLIESWPKRNAREYAQWRLDLSARLGLQACQTPDDHVPTIYKKLAA